MNNPWWKETIVYQIYPRSFQDSNGDGIGDLPGITQRLDYIANLGVETLWLNPIYESPNVDNGYDVSNYKSIMQDFGSMEDFDLFLAEAKTRNLRVILDLIPNHTSDQHHWFQQSKQSKNNPYRDYYFWKKPKKDGSAPTNWEAFFHPSTWTLDPTTNEYYLHLFSPNQPDLNWENPKVRQEIYDVMHFWMQKGIDGFRIDVLTFLSKDLNFPNQTKENFTGDTGKFFGNGPRLHEFLQEMHQEVLQHYDLMTVGEGAGITPENAHLFVGADRKELHTIYHFDQMGLDKKTNHVFVPTPYSLVEFKEIVQRWDAVIEKNAWNTCYLGNHDFPRMLSRFGNDQEFHTESAKLLAMFLLTQRATPYLYFGDEIGMTNASHWNSLEDYKDLQVFDGYNKWIANGKEPKEFIQNLKSTARDHGRTPMQWNKEKNGGFSKAKPWIEVNPNYKTINVVLQQKDPNSILNFYKKLITIRKKHKVMIFGEYKDLLPNHEQLYVYTRSNAQSTFCVLLNFSDSAVNLPTNLLKNQNFDVLLNNYANFLDHKKELHAWQCVLLRFRN